MVTLLVLTALLAYPVQAWAEDPPRFEKSTLMVSGTGRLAVIPDTAFLTFGMETAGKSLDHAQRQNTEAMHRVIARLRELQIEKERIQTSSFTVSPQYQPPSRRTSDASPAPPQIIGYVVSSSVTVEVRNTDRVAAVVEAALAAGANHFQGLRWALRDEQQGRLDALKQAAGQARDKAVALSQALTLKLVRLISVNEGGQVGQPGPMASRSMMALEGVGSEPPMLPGEMKIEATVTLLYEVTAQ